jgi:Zn-dependent M28 family amino/carboxypeptidase
LQIPETQDFPYDSYAGLEVEGKIVLVLRYFPEDVDQETRALLARYSGLRYKARAAREHGATAMLVVTGPRSPNAGATIPMAFDTAVSGSDIVAASVDGEVADAIFEAVADRDLEAAQKALDDGNPHVAGFAIPGVEVTLTTAVERERREGFNVAGYIAGSEEGLDKPWVLLGAHYDHLGRGGGGNSLAGKEEQNEVHHGADDNASGTAAVLDAARRLAADPPRRPVAVAFWSGEELGLLGANAFLEQAIPTQPELNRFAIKSAISSDCS